MTRGIASGLLTIAAGGLAAAQPPRVENAQISSQAAGGSLARTINTLAEAQSEPAWIGYGVPAVPGDRTMCCFDGGAWRDGDGHGCCGVCRLERSTTSGSFSGSTPQPGPDTRDNVVRLEGSDRMIVLLRAAERRIDRVRLFSEGCRLDAGGRRVIWLEGVRPTDSVAYLESLAAADAGPRDHRVDGTVAAIALHADAAADAALDRLLAAGQPERIRRAVPFWLGHSRGAPGLTRLRRLLKEETSTEVRKKAVFGISQSPEPGAVDTLIDAARHASSATVRGEAIFWLGQKAGRKAADAITERIDQDPEVEVKKRAVFALSQLPPDEGVPLLLRVARTHSSPAVRKQAMFWLGQSKDARAIDFFAEILK